MNLQFYSGTQVNGHRFIVIILKSVVPVSYNFFSIYIYIGIKYNSNTIPNKIFTIKF
jgi:hypothetical protein